MATFEEWLTWTFSPTISAILVTLLVSLLSPILIHWYLYRKAVSKELPVFLLIGPSGGGKTSLLTLLANGSPSDTHTSQAPQSATCQLPNTVRSSEDRYRSENDPSAGSASGARFTLLDTPGHGKLRHHAFSSLAPSSTPSQTTRVRGLVFVVDSAALSAGPALAEAAAYLHDALLLLQRRQMRAASSRAPQAIAVLVAANKQDVFSSLPTALVRKRLEEEIARVRVTRSKGLMDSGVGMENDAGAAEDDEEGAWLGEYGSKTFSFTQMEEHGVDVKVLGGSVRGEGEEGANVDEWWDWIGENL